MRPLHHREPGMVGAALAHAQFAELIPDLLHVHPGAIRVALRSIPHLYCVTDSTAATGMPDGEYRLGRQPVTKCLGGVRLADGTRLLVRRTMKAWEALKTLAVADATDPASSCKPFSKDRSGLVLGEGGCSFMRSTILTTRIFKVGMVERSRSTAASVSSAKSLARGLLFCSGRLCWT